jgi:protein-tyrosine phosphatase
MPSVLFVCTGNQYRSPIAAAAFRRQLERDGLAATWSVDSAGTWTPPDLPPFPDALRVAGGLGLDLGAHRTSPIEARDLGAYDLILVMEQGHKEAILTEFAAARGRVHLLSDMADGLAYDVPDPAKPGADLAQVARQLTDLIRRAYPAIRQLTDSSSGGS